MKVKDKINTEVLVREVFKCPDIMSGRTNFSVYMEDKNNEYIWNTFSNKFPEVGTKTILTAVIAETKAQGRSVDKDIFRVVRCSFK